MEVADILVIEDNLGDQRLIREAFRESNAQLHFVHDGEEAIAFLQQEGKYAQMPLPSIVLMDLNLPKIGGRELLTTLKADPKLRCIPVIIFTSSKSDEDIWKAYECHANCYITKPVELDGFLNAMRAIENFWLNIVELPKRRLPRRTASRTTEEKDPGRPASH
jgi:CheY-like chemotaxis protein